ncbi:winged helix DNA-binding domain-containing protein [Nitrospirillum viridazoti]|uniref:Winged helix DNA-binding domain-containing protein n=1 Tax=Nitrospirillum viridazoti CBAmc TaxID=1441467 RepID=A0A248JSX4_9PROT|nr:winged helix DNA-binding domain-containing protein [Nitrospirillum amazonense]ASG21610.1 hypothetical protein Y958_12935 [Nitrospirillum amazonense CBAmc]TWB42243.1 winged helix DNA-binding protein [Nitrospirillum amazonense]
MLTAARTLLGAQAQVHSAAILQLRARTAALADAEVAGALHDSRSLVKLWAQRSTLHLMPTADLGDLLALRRLKQPEYHAWYSREGLPPERVAVLIDAVVQALADGPHSRMDLSRRLVPQLGDWAQPWLEHSWGGVLKLACALGHLCHGPPRPDDNEAAFVGLPAWLGQAPVVPADSAHGVANFLRRYLAAYGPATPSDFRKFAGIPAGPCRQAFQNLAGELLAVELDGRPAYALARDEEALRRAEMPAGHLAVLPLFDPWLLAHADTAQVVDARHRTAIYRQAGWISAVVLRQGRVAATWTHRRLAVQGQPVWEVELAPLSRLTKAERRVVLDRLRHLSGGLDVRYAGG